MPPQRKQPLHPSNKNIKDFFKPFTIPRNRRPANDTEEDEIVVASSPSKERRNDDGGEDITRSPGEKKAGGLSAKHGRAGVKAVRRERITVKDSEDAALSTRVEQSEAQIQVESSALSSLPADLSPLPSRKAPRKQEEESSSALSSLLSQVSPPKRREASRGQAEASSSALSSLPSDLSPYKPVTTPRAASRLRASLTPQGKAAALKSELPILSSPSSAVAKRRVLAAVVIPSSSPRPEAASPTPTPMPATDGARDMTSNSSPNPAAVTTTTFPAPSASTQQQQQLAASFSSTATTSSSRRIRKNGVQGVTNSDSDSGIASSDDELAEASTFVPRKRMKLTPEHPVGPVLPSGKDRENAIEIVSGGERDGRRRSSRKAFGESAKAGNDNLPSSLVEIKKKPKLKHSLVALVRQQQREEQSETRLRTLQAEFEAEELRRTAERMESNVAAGLHSLGATASDGEDGERMKLAIQRTEAGEGEEEFFYFKGLKEGIADDPYPNLGHDPFPKVGTREASAWFNKLLDEKWRTQAFLSGFVRDIAATKGLPPRVRHWIISQLLFEPREEICEAYVAVLEACHFIATEAENLYGLGDIYDTSTTASRGSQDAVESGAQDPNPQFSPIQGLCYFVRLLRCSSLGHAEVGAALQELLFAKLDIRVARNAKLKSVIDDTIESLLQSPYEPVTSLEAPSVELARQWDWWRRQEDIVFPALVAALQSTEISLQLRCRAVAAMPVYSPTSHRLRRYLALTLLLSANSEYATTHGRPSTSSQTSKSPPLTRWILPLEREGNGRALLQTLNHSPLFLLSEETDFITLNHAIRVLDIAIDGGFGPAATPPLWSAPMSKTHPYDTYSPAHTSPNTLIDAFITRIAVSAAQIKDAGTTHLSRTLAKSALERLGKRLEYCVRSKPRKRQGVFGLGSGSGFGVKEQSEMSAKESGGGEGMLRAFVSDGWIEMEGSADALAGALVD